MCRAKRDYSPLAAPARLPTKRSIGAKIGQNKRQNSEDLPMLRLFYRHNALCHSGLTHVFQISRFKSAYFSRSSSATLCAAPSRLLPVATRASDPIHAATKQQKHCKTTLFTPYFKGNNAEIFFT